MNLPDRLEVIRVFTLAIALIPVLIAGCSETPTPAPATAPVTSVEATTGSSKPAKKGAVSKPAAQTPGSGDYEDKPGGRARGR